MKLSLKITSHWITNILLHPAVIIIPFTLIVWFFIPGINNRYNCELLRTNPGAKESRDEIAYSDFDNNGFSEYIITGYNDRKAFCTLNNRERLYEQYNFDGIFPDINRFYCSDLNNDDKKELFIFIARHDSLFINQINPVKGEHRIFPEKFMTIIKKSVEVAWSIMDITSYDLNSDGTSEVLMLLTAGFQRKPRIVMAYDAVNDSVLKSPDIIAFGIDIDVYTRRNEPFITVSNYASCNYQDTAGIMDDWSSYRIILDRNLQFAFPLIELKGDYCGYFLTPFYHEKDTFLLSKITETLNKPLYRLQLSDGSGNILKQTSYNFDSENFMSFTVFCDSKGNSKILVTYRADRLELLDHNLKVIKVRKIKAGRLWEYPSDINNDGESEFILNSINPGELIIIREDLSSPVIITPGDNGFIYPPQLILRGNEDPHFLLQIGNNKYYYSYTKSNILSKYSALAIIYLIIFGFTLLIRRLQRNQLKRKYETLQMIAELKFVNIRNQMDPHFTFNILNTLGSFILQNKPEESYNILVKYSKFLRTTITSSDSLFVTLDEELKFINNYLELQKIKFKERICSTITIEDNVDMTTTIPRMVIHTYVENAIKHGISSLDVNGCINIRIWKEENQLCITITDNGIGRKRAAESRFESTGKGHIIMQQFYKLLNELNNDQIKEEITDLVDNEGNAAGTRVMITIPLKLEYKLRSQ